MSVFLRKPGPRQTRAAFTLAESLVSMGVLVVLVGGLVSAMVLSTRALPANAAERQTASRAMTAAEQVAEDTRAALWFIERAAQRVTFTVPDRNGDGVPERITYSWDGTPGSDLLRSVNGGTAAAFVSSVDSFALSYETATQTETFVAAPVESAETVLRSFRASSPVGDLAITTSRYQGEYFRPTLPADALSWSVKRASIYAKTMNSNDGVNNIELYAADGSNLPRGTSLGSRTFNEGDLSSSYAKSSYSFSGVSGLAPGSGLCLIVRGVSGGGTTVALEHQTSGVAFANAGLLTYSSSWSIRTDRAMSFEISGTYTQPGGNQTMQRTFITAIGVKLTAGGQPASAGAKTLNRPEALSAWWNTDFTQNPTLDGNGDGNPDWEARGLPINLGGLIGHSWTGTQKLFSTPDCTFLKPTRVTVRFAAAAVVGSVAEFSLPFAWGVGTYAGIVAKLTNQLDGTQTLTVATKTSDANARTLLTVSNLSNRTVELGLRLDPTLETVNIETDGRSRGTFRYDRYTPVNDEPRVTVAGSGGGGIFESVSIRVAE